jgi:hypothetical protein
MPAIVPAFEVDAKPAAGKIRQKAERMGFYIRKSISVGPFRFNLSQSGVGVSTGIKGFRIGTGPRGNYIHMGRGGLYFRATIPTEGPGKRPGQPDAPAAIAAGEEGFQELEAGSVSRMVDSSSAQLLEEINAKAQRRPLWVIAFAAACVLNIIPIAAKTPLWLLWLTAPLSVCAAAWAAYWDTIKKTVVIFYSMEPHLEEAYQALHNAFDTMQSCSGKWHLTSQRETSGLYDWKTHGGADAIVNRRTLRLPKGRPPYVKTNILVPVLPARQMKLYFFPDRVLVYDGSRVGAAGYADIQISWTSVRFQEDGSVPSDAKVVGSTWRYVNKSGGPDRRFSNNSEIPIVLYEEVHITSNSGLSEVVQLSRQGLGAELKKAILGMVKAMSSTGADGGDEFVVCPCNVCSGHIEFPARGAGETVACPFCGMETVLFVPAPST